MCSKRKRDKEKKRKRTKEQKNKRREKKNIYNQILKEAWWHIGLSSAAGSEDPQFKPQ